MLDGMSGAIAERFPDDDDEVHFARLDDAERLLEEADELDGYLDQPIGEVIAKLCKALGLDPDWAVERDGEWFVKQPDFVPDFACDWPDAPPRGPEAPASEDAGPRSGAWALATAFLSWGRGPRGGVEGLQPG